MSLKDELWKRKAFISRAIFSLTLIAGVGSYAADRYTLGFDPAENRCLADYRSFLVDERNSSAARNELVAFHASGLDPFFEDGTTLAKYVRGVPGDHVEITADQEVLVNGEVIEVGLPYAEHLNQTPDDFVGELIVPDGTLWVMGDTDYSFDSRYWGVITTDQIRGKAHGLF